MRSSDILHTRGKGGERGGGRERGRERGWGRLISYTHKVLGIHIMLQNAIWRILTSGRKINIIFHNPWKVIGGKSSSLFLFFFFLSFFLSFNVCKSWVLEGNRTRLVFGRSALCGGFVIMFYLLRVRCWFWSFRGLLWLRVLNLRVRCLVAPKSVKRGFGKYCP